MEMITKMTGDPKEVATANPNCFNVGKAQMSLRNPQHKLDRDAHYEAIGGLQAAVKDLNVLELWSSSVVRKSYLVDDFLAMQLINLMKSVGPAATNDFNGRIPDRAVEACLDMSGDRLRGVQVTLTGAMKIVTPSIATLDDRKAYIKEILAPLAAISIMNEANRLMREADLSSEKREVCHDVMKNIEAQFGEYLTKSDEFIMLIRACNQAYERETFSLVTSREVDDLKLLSGFMKDDESRIAGLLSHGVRWVEFTRLFKALGPSATERMETMFSDVVIDEYGMDKDGLPGIYFQNDGETVSFVDHPSLQDKKNYLNYVLAPVLAKSVMDFLQSFSQAKKEQMSVRDREAYRALMLTLKHGFAEYLNPATGYIDNLKAWKKRGGKINKCLIMKK